MVGGWIHGKYFWKEAQGHCHTANVANRPKDIQKGIKLVDLDDMKER